ncbi:putative glycosyl transferase [Methanosarcina siciliae T4/M]|uniref:Putative glycosyl transferase n=1 Tax=Methanosarcina siciliae T4/M TaxID=1434120 RepID=A0A0E3P901_9EURY|nr:glycosyltransferase family A protein [Methanosarcina siciliae]AKB30474.1 putative glycosyl transferase [Methanosarcina siciliae T4/M]
MPLVSVIIPLYNKEPYISHSLNSVLGQSFQNFEIVVIDDGSTDKSAEVVKGFTDPRIRLIKQENAGVSAARNKGIEESKADLIAFLDADDEWTPSFLETVLRLREKYPEAGAYATSYNILKNGDLKPARYNAVPPAPWEGLLQSYFLTVATGEHPVCSSAVCIPKKIFSKVGIFQIGAWWGEDDDLWGRIALKYPIAFSREIGAIYHKEATNRACNLRSQIEEHPFVKTAKNAINKGEVRKEIQDDLTECISKYQILSAIRNIKSGNRQLAKKELKKCGTKLFAFEKTFWYCITFIPYKISSYMIDTAVEFKKYSQYSKNIFKIR